MADADSPLFRFQLWRAGLPPALRLLLTVNLVTYVGVVILSLFARFGAPGLTVIEWLILPPTPAGVFARPWTPFTYGFVNFFPGFFGLISFVFGFWWLSWMGREYEEEHGPHRLFGLYVVSALGGALLALVVGLVVPAGGAAGLWTPVTGILCAVATLHPDRKVGLFLLGIVPMKWIAIGFVVLSLAFSTDLTVLGAALTGFAFARAQQGGVDLASWARPLFDRRPRAAEPARRPSPFVRSTPSPSKSASPKARGGGARDIDQILDKILEKGYDSLTEEERTILDRASRD